MVYEALPEPLRVRIDRLSSYQMFDFGSGFDYNRRSRDEDASPDAIRAVHPLVWTDPDSGRRVLFMSEHTTIRLNEVGEARARRSSPSSRAGSPIRASAIAIAGAWAT
jgi:taurine dioxygenase